MESWQTLHSFPMQTRTITWTELQKFKEFGQGLNKVGKHRLAFQHSKRYSEAWNKAQTFSSFGCQEQGALSICCSSKGIGFTADMDHFSDKSPFKWAISLSALTLHFPHLATSFSLPQAQQWSTLIWLKARFSTAHSGTDASNWEKVTHKHSPTGLETLKLHLELVLSQVNGGRENVQHLHVPKLNKLGVKQDFGRYLESSGTVNLNTLYVTLWQIL